MALNLSDRVKKARLFFDRSEFTVAEKELRAILVEYPGQVEAMALLGATCFRTRRHSEASAVLTAVLKLDPWNYDALVWLGIVRRSRGADEEAIKFLEKAYEQNSLDKIVLINLGQCWLGLGNTVKAIELFDELLRLDPRSAQGHYYKALAQKQKGEVQMALKTLSRAIELNPNPPVGYVQVLKFLHILQNWSEGISILEDGYKRNPNSIPVRVALATAYGKTGQQKEAEELFVAAWNQDPLSGPPYALWLQEVGREAQALNILNESVARAPVQGQSYYYLTLAQVYRVGDRRMDEVVIEVLADQQLQDESRMYLHYALAKTYEYRKNFEKSMIHFHVANDLAYRSHNVKSNFNLLEPFASAARVKSAYTKAVVDSAVGANVKVVRPLFLIGMVRSGLTLLDQMLSSHTVVSSRGECPYWALHAEEGTQQLASGKLSQELLESLAHNYMNLSSDAQVLTDRMYENYRYAGLIRMALPSAKFVHLRRNPLDTCVSMMTTFIGDTIPFAYHPDHIVGTYRAYLDLMAHWRSILGQESLLEIDYEELVNQPKETLSKVLEFCGLPWEEDCICPEKHPLPVEPPSLWTSRRPIYTSSINRAKNFDSWLGALGKLKEVPYPKY